MKLVFHGEVATGDAYRVDDEDSHGSIIIGGRDVVAQIESAKFAGPVTVAVADESFTGDLDVELGWGYSEYTPVDPDKLKVGPHNVIEVLERHEGKKVTLWVSDEPVNVLEGKTDD